MPTGIKDLRVYQAAREAAYGTAVAATNRLVGDLEITPQEKVIEPQPQIGVLIANPVADLVVERAAEVKLSGDLTYEQVLYLLEAAIRGNQTPAGAGADKTWTYASLYTGDPLLKSMSLQRRLTDGTTTWDEGVAYALCKDFKISAAIGDVVKFDSTWFGRPVDTAVALTPAIAVPAVNFIAASDVKVYIDDTFAGLGVTQLLGDVISWDLSATGMYQPKYFQDGRADRSFATHSLLRQDYNASIQVEWNAQISALRAKAASRAIQYVRIVATGPTLGASNYKVQFDFAARFKEAQFDQKGDRQGNDTVTLEFVAAYDTTNLIGLKAVVVNALTAWV